MRQKEERHGFRFICRNYRHFINWPSNVQWQLQLFIEKTWTLCVICEAEFIPKSLGRVLRPQDLLTTSFG
jgi:hypothetical protein